MENKVINIITKSIEVNGMVLKYNVVEYANYVEFTDMMIFDSDRPDDCLLIKKGSKMRHVKKVLDEFLKEQE